VSDPEAEKAGFRWELMKLLLQVAWADDRIADQERRILTGLAGRLSLGPERTEALEHCLEQGTPLPAPDMALLRSRRAEVIEAAEQLVMVDGEIDDDENRMLVELHALLGDDEGPA
jgi:uncharacterized tellurite resistance protein B-like protein